MNTTRAIVFLITTTLLWALTIQYQSLKATTTSKPERQLTFNERVTYQRAIEEVYWLHRIWPKENSSPKPNFDEVVPLSAIQDKVRNYLRKSYALEAYFYRPITGIALQAEIERMARQTKRPEILGELWAALNNDPFLIAECLSRSILADRLIRESYETELAGIRANKMEDRKQTSFDEWWQSLEENFPADIRIPEFRYHIDFTERTNSLCADDMWEPSQSGPPSARWQHTAIWTGNEMIVWGGSDSTGQINTGGRYNPTTDTWIATTTVNAPSRRELHTVVWTGTEMIVWGGFVSGPGSGNLNTGGRYNPVSDTWIEISTTNVPTARYAHTAIWTGTEMIVWGGGFYTDTGGRYNPSTDTWTATNTTNAPDARSNHTAVWTGTEMIVWGGISSAGLAFPLNTGGRYDPTMDVWTPTNMTNAPTGRHTHTAIWTGTEMIIWGGSPISPSNSGGRYNPATDTWIPTSTTGAPEARHSHNAVWTGSQMIIWGGAGGAGGNVYLNSGGRYNPATNTWQLTSTTNAPFARTDSKAIWTGSEMIIWGGYLTNTGGRYNPVSNTWTITSTNPRTRINHTAVWTGTEMIIFGGYDGSYPSVGDLYNPATETWQQISMTNAPGARSYHTAVWTGTEMIVWGGELSNNLLNSGGRYNPATNTWQLTSAASAPSMRSNHTAVWTGSEMIVWGGVGDSGLLNTGGRYNPTNNLWTTIPTVGSPSPRINHTAVWTGSEMIVWGGNSPSNIRLNTGGRYNPNNDAWTDVHTTNAPTQRELSTAIWTGTEIIIWGGFDSSNQLSTGGRYNPSSDSWRATSIVGAPSGRSYHTAVWTGDEMIVWGGSIGTQPTDTGSRYDPITDTWQATNTIKAPDARSLHTTIWTGGEMIVWGGIGNGSGFFNTGGIYCATCPISFIPVSQVFSSRGGEARLNVVTQNGCEWNVFSNDSWITPVLPSSGTSNGYIYYVVRENLSNSPRAGTISIAGRNFTVIQEGHQLAGCTYNISPFGQAFPQVGGVGSISVQVSKGCGWTASSNTNWVIIDSGKIGIGNGTVNYFVAPNNTGSSRKAMIRIGRVNFDIKQKG